MLGNVTIRRGRKDEAEKPFWISYADLMTALMVLFLVTMAVALISVSPKIDKVDETERRKKQYEREIRQLLEEVEKAAQDFPSIRVDKDKHRIDFGSQATFALDSAVVRPDVARTLRAYVPRILAIARSPLGQRWVKQIVVEGFASPEGGYFHNLRLSMDRSRAVLCALYAKPGIDETPLKEEELFQIQDLFLIGGYSFNSLKPNPEDSRRVEMRLDFLGFDEERPPAVARERSKLDRCQ